MRIVILGFVLLVAGVAQVSAAVYFVDYAGGSDANAGSSQNLPWKHCPGDPAAAGTASIVALAPGDTVHFKGGVEYVFTGPTGIRLDRNGGVGALITYDGNSDGTWGTGRAVLTDRRGSNAITAFSSSAERRHLVFKGFEFYALGGAAGLPADTGVPVAGRFGGGIAFNGGAVAVLIEDCVFREIGFWQGEKPMARSSLTGIGIAGTGKVQMTISRCDFSRVARGCDLSAANNHSQVKLEKCDFGEALVWPLDLPGDFGNVAILALDVKATKIPGPSTLYRSSWSGYGLGPLIDEINAAYGEQVVFSVSALGAPGASFRWFRNGAAVSGGFGSRLDLGAADVADAGTYTVTATNAAGSAASNTIILVVTGAPAVPPPSTTTSPPPSATTSPPPSTTTSPPPPSPPAPPSSTSPPPPVEIAIAPQITQHPVGMSVEAGGTATFTASATGTPVPTYQWQKNGVPLAGATGPVLTFSSVTSNDSANFRVVVSNLAGTVTSALAPLTVTQPPPTSSPPASTPPLLVTTLVVRYSYDSAVTSFVIPGEVTRRVLIRALGPTYAAIGGEGAISDPTLRLIRGTSVHSTNNDWGGAGELALASSQVGAVPFVSPDSKDSALVVTLAPGPCMLMVTGYAGVTGNVLVEVYVLP